MISRGGINIHDKLLEIQISTENILPYYINSTSLTDVAKDIVMNPLSAFEKQISKYYDSSILVAKKEVMAPIQRILTKTKIIGLDEDDVYISHKGDVSIVDPLQIYPIQLHTDLEKVSYIHILESIFTEFLNIFMKIK